MTALTTKDRLAIERCKMPEQDHCARAHNFLERARALDGVPLRHRLPLDLHAFGRFHLHDFSHICT